MSAESEPADAPAAGPPSEPRRRRRRVLPCIAALALLVLAAAMSGLGWLLMGYPNPRGPGRGRVVEIVIAEQDGVDAVAGRLHAAGVLAEPELFAAYAELRGAEARLRRGPVLLYDSMTPRALLQRVARGFGSAELRVVIPEGFSRFEIAGRLAQWGVCSREAFLRASEDEALLLELAIDGPSAEGFLFPDTYLLQDDMDPRALVRRFVHNARRRLAPLFAQHEAARERLRSELGWGTEEILALASIVEKEARLVSEQPIIAGVFLNRLRDPAFSPKRLQADPTVSYGCAVAPDLPSCAEGSPKRLTRAMLADAGNPYNTYRHAGLPPGPIANPGVRAVRAVLAPAAHDFLYFVARGQGAHTFSRTLGDHNAAIEERRARSQQPAQ